MRPLANPAAKRRAATLMEVMVAMGLIVIVTGFAYSLFEVGRQFTDGLQEKTKGAIAKVTAPAKKIAVRAPLPSQPLPPVTPLAVPVPVFANPFVTPPPPAPVLSTEKKSVTMMVERPPVKESGANLLLAQGELAPLALPKFDSPAVAADSQGDDVLWKTYDPEQAFQLESLPGASHIIYLDFTGHFFQGTYWNDNYNGGNDFTIPPWSKDATRGSLGSPNFTTEEKQIIIRVWQRVSEDYMPFNVNVTTKEPTSLEDLKKTSGENSTSGKWGMRVVFGPHLNDSSVGVTGAIQGYRGVAPSDSFNSPVSSSNDYYIALVDIGDVSYESVEPGSAGLDAYMADTTSHEVGHTLGLDHDGQTTSGVEYYRGHGTGNVSWRPIMGSSPAIGTTRRVTQWSNGGSYPLSNNSEDDITRIVTLNGFSHRPDDYGDDAPSATALNAPLETTLKTTYGVIGANQLGEISDNSTTAMESKDQDWFKFYAGVGPINIRIDPLSLVSGDPSNGANLDIKAELYDSEGNHITTSNENPLNELWAEIATTLPSAGQYYLRISGTGRADSNPGDTEGEGYTGYGSLGNFRISGTVTAYNPNIPASPTTVRILNPLIWIHDSATQSTWGYMSFTNVMSSSIVNFDLELTLPHTSLAVRQFEDKHAGGGVTPSGNKYTMSLTSTLAPGQPRLMYISVQNPQKMALPVGLKSFPAKLTIQSP